MPVAGRVRPVPSRALARPMSGRRPMNHQLAQINIGRVRGPLDGEVMREFMEALDEINALAERSPGFVWRFKTDAGNATPVQAYADPRLLVNLSVWESVESLRHYVYRSRHGRFFARRSNWFEKFDAPHLALWWVPKGALPTLEDAKRRLEMIAANGDSPAAFTFARIYSPDGEAVS